MTEFTVTTKPVDRNAVIEECVDLVKGHEREKWARLWEGSQCPFSKEINIISLLAKLEALKEDKT